MAENQRYIRDNSEADNSDWQNPRLTGRNKLPGRFESLPLPGLNDNDNPWVVSLDGDWKFSFYACPADVPEGVERTRFSDRSWGTVPVPANWEMHGHGIPRYNNVIFPYSHDTADPPAIDPRNNPTGVYRTKFTVPAAWKDRRDGVILRFEGIRSAAHIYLNGEELGYTQNSYSPAEFAIGSLLKKGNNYLTVVVYKWCAGTYLEDQDMWRMAGIFRPVSLLATTSGSLFDVYARCRFDSSFIDADFTVTAVMESGGTDVPSGRSLRWYLYEEGGDDIIASSPSLTVDYRADGRTELEHTLIIHEPKKWSAEKPDLYNLVVEHSEEDGTVVDRRAIPWGFRQIDIVPTPKGAVFRVNGRPVKLRGVNRHDIHPRHGQAVPPEIIESDLILMKRHNINAVRCSHYPNPRVLYEIADRLGLYVIDEASLESHGLRASIPASLPEWTDNCIDRVERMVLAHRNHPCIILWSLGNEAGLGKNFRLMKKTVLELDSTRPVHYEGDHKLDTSDVFSLMYPSTRQVSRIGRRRSLRVGAEEGHPLGWVIVRRQYRNKPFMMCEFSHAMGNSLGNFAEYMELVEKHRNIFGAFIWDFSDQALCRKDENGVEYLAYGGEFGEQPHDGIFCADGITDAERNPYPEMAEVKALYSPIVFEAVDLLKGDVRIINRNSQVDLQGYEITWNLEREGVEVASGSIRRPDILPGESRKVNIYRDLASYPGKGEGFLNFSVRLKESTAWAEEGYELSRLQVPVPETEGTAPPKDLIFDHLPVVENPEEGIPDETVETPPETPPAEWRHERSGDHLLAAGAGLGARFRLDDGSLETLDFGKGDVLAGPLEPDFYRAPTDNENAGIAQFIGESVPDNRFGKWISRLAYRIADIVYGRYWEAAARSRRVTGHKVYRSGEDLVVRFRLAVTGFLGRVDLTYRLQAAGSVKVALRGTSWRQMIRFGTRMVIHGRYSRVSWFGRGPQECYADRKTGALVSLHTMDAADMSCNYLNPQESGNRTDVRRVSFSDGGSAVMFRAVDGRYIDFSAGYASREEVEQAGHVHEIRFSKDIHVDIDFGQRGVGGAFPGILGLLRRYRMKAFRSRSLAYTITRETPGLTSAEKAASPQSS